MKPKQNEGEGSHAAKSDDRRQFLRNALKFGGAALLLTSGSREVLAKCLTLNSAELDAARRAQQAEGAPSQPRRMEAGSRQSYGMEGGCENSCLGGCQGCTASCAHSCTGSCLGGCQGDCKGGCLGGCKGGCQGTCQGQGVG